MIGGEAGKTKSTRKSRFLVGMIGRCDAGSAGRPEKTVYLPSRKG